MKQARLYIIGWMTKSIKMNIHISKSHIFLQIHHYGKPASNESSSISPQISKYSAVRNVFNTYLRQKTFPLFQPHFQRFFGGNPERYAGIVNPFAGLR